ncbi:MAG: CCA tRNA nucleotidyltransferase [Rhodospirillaceae bacterium]|jgi:poly(A) polymerase|nr:CCA tRNA nucleotidyltransferase [Rhodospirillales bacterium]MBT3906899.1 CCA tRNA nucleotidyltransferase [Rhodospirillaceae bacterium]MBT4700439.1 CCA tRNA nucleotidyltransferase [Rhodospirillaceae bacterium]MBT5033288.1 CCA tRNA nucleotidyltransferase [Rhodospirillaceae bacterium]MBT6220952.1 CCA tRNA nucleotidyltransferase [Rhodospirillaceae bacterium]
MAAPSETLPPLVPTGKIPPQPWMTAPEIRSVMSALTAKGAEVRFVGGCVRDAIRKIETHDIDIATPTPPEEVMALLEGRDIKVIPTGLKHGTVTVVSGIWNMEITTLRIDLQTDGRRARVAFTDDWIADAARRDFTINTLSATLDGDVYDPFSGMDDLATGHVRFVGNAQDRIEEDILRLLRFFRMHAIYSKFGPDKTALAACRNLAPRLTELSGERVRTELFRILMAPEPADTLTIMRGEKVLEPILPEASNIGRLRTLTFLETRAINVESVVPDVLRRFAAVLELEDSMVEDLATRMKLSNKQAQRLTTLMAVDPPTTPEVNSWARRQRLRRLGPDMVRDLVLLAWAEELATEPRRSSKRTAEWIELLEEVDAWGPVKFPLKGKDVLDQGLEPGAKVGEILRNVENWWESEDYSPDREACLKYLKDLMAK